MGFQASLPFVLLLATAFSGCATDDGVELGPKPDYDPGVTAADFVEGIDNPWLPFVVGATWTFEFDEDGERGLIEVEVLGETKHIMGVEATVVRDTETIDGELAEDTWDWFAQDTQGNVWYLGEDTCEYEDGECVDTGGAWEWGKDGALPGIVMWADPENHAQPYYQEFYWGEAIDQAKFVDSGREVEVEAGTFTDTITTREWNPVEGGSESGEGEFAHYARGVGVVLKESTDSESDADGERLVSYNIPTPP